MIKLLPEVIFIINLKLLNEKGECKFKAYGEELDARYNGEYEPGDRWRIDTDYTEFVKISLDEALNASIVHLPDKTFEFRIPFDAERKSCYAPGAFGGDSHRIVCSEPSEA